MLKKLDSEAESAKQELFKLVWYMRGGITIDQAYMLSHNDQKLIANVIKDNIKNTEKSGLPLL